MIIALERIQSAGQSCFEQVMALCTASFPPEERRDRDALLLILNDPLLNFCAVTEDGTFAGLVIYWKFSRFIFVEQLAVVVDRRRSGAGSRILGMVRQEGLPVLLEVERPYDETSLGRTGFYHRNGFRPLPVRYTQPPYREGDQVLPMQLYSDHSEWPPALLEECIRQFHSKVYFHNS